MRRFAAAVLGLLASSAISAQIINLVHDLARRDELYKEFIATASQVYSDALVHSEPQIDKIVALYAMISRMRVLSTPQIVERAERIMRLTTETYSAPNRTIDQLQELIESDALDPLKQFSEAAHEERIRFL